MTISPAMIVGVLRAAVRIYHAGDRALSQHVRDRAHNIPNADPIGVFHIPNSAAVSDAVLADSPPGFQEFVNVDLRLLGAWENLERGDESGLGILVEALANFELQAKAKDAATDANTEEQYYEAVFTVAIANWDPDDPNRPVTPWMHFAVSLADVGLEFVGSNPSILGIGGNAEKLLGSFAKSVSDLIPDDGQFGTQQTLGLRVLGIVARAGLTTFSSHAGDIVDEKHLQELIQNVSKPIITSLTTANFEEAVKWQAVTDAMLGPAAQAAFETVAQHQKAFLGDGFDTEKAVGALTHSFLKTLATQDLADGITREHGLALYKAALGVIAERPELFIGKDDNSKDVFFRDLLTKVGTAAQGLEPPLNADFVSTVAAAALESLQGNIGALVNVTDQAGWEAVIDRSLESIVGGLKEGVAAGGNFDKLFSKQQLTDVSRIFLNQIAKTPGLIAGDGDELKNIVAGVARAMAADNNLLLSGDDWLEIVAVAAEEAAANPGRLFKFGTDSQVAGFAEIALKQLFKNTATDLRTAREDGQVLFGDTMKRTIIATLRGLSGDAVAAAQALANDKLASLVEQLNQLVTQKDASGDFEFGAKEWLALYHAMLERLIATGNLETFMQNNQLTADGKVLVEGILNQRT